MDESKHLLVLKESVVNLDFEGVVKAAREAMNEGVDPVRAITDGMAEGMKVVGERFEKGEYFLSELIVAGAVMMEGVEIINPHIKGDVEVRGKVVLATVKGDNHDIGKTLVANLLRADGFKVIDLGMDVASQRIVEAVMEHKPDILGMSALLTITMPVMGEVIEGLKAASIRNKVKVIVGGTPVTKEFADSIDADHRAENAVEGVERCKEWVTSKE